MLQTNVTPTQIDLVKNDNYWGGDVKVDKVTVKSFADGSALTAALQTGDIQGTYGLQYDNYPCLKKSGLYHQFLCDQPLLLRTVQYGIRAHAGSECPQGC